METKRIILALLLASLIFSCLSPSLYSQCAMCRTTAESSSVQNPEVAAGLNNGILYLMTLPYILLGIIFFTWWSYRRKKKSQATPN